MQSQKDPSKDGSVENLNMVRELNEALRCEGLSLLLRTLAFTYSLTHISKQSWGNQAVHPRGLANSRPVQYLQSPEEGSTELSHLRLAFSLYVHLCSCTHVYTCAYGRGWGALTWRHTDTVVSLSLVRHCPCLWYTVIFLTLNVTL